MKTISINDFKPVANGVENILYFRVDSRTCSTRYLILQGDKKLLIDSGDGKDELSFVPDECILTHGHYDHTCGVRENWPSVWICENEDSTLPYMNFPKNAKKLKEGKFKFGKFTFEIISTPGHTHGGICIFEPKSKILFAGDTKFAGGGWGRTDFGGSDGEIQKSLLKIDKIKWKILCPAHGDIEIRK